MGGRGATSGQKSSIGKRIVSLYNDVINGNASIDDFQKLAQNMNVSKATFTTNANSVKSQHATLESGTEKIDLSFYTDYNPQQTTGRAIKAIKTTISATTWKNGNATAIRKIMQMSSKSYANAEKQYKEMLGNWKKATGQKNITFK